MEETINNVENSTNEAITTSQDPRFREDDSSQDEGQAKSARNDETTGTSTETTEEGKEELTTETNLYDNTDNTNPDAETDYIDFNTEGLTEFKDVFKNSKITKAEFETFKEKIAEKSSVKEFSKDMINTYGEDAPQILKEYQQLTNDIFTPEEKEALNKLPSFYKTLMVKMGKSLGDKYIKLQSDYGVLNQDTQAIPESTKHDANERFSKLTQQLMNGGFTAEEYDRINRERMDLIRYM